MTAAAVVAAVVLAGSSSVAQTQGAPPDLSPATLKLQHDIDARLAAPELERATWGVVVTSLSTGETLYSRNPNKLLLPASNMKVVTLAAAAERLGWDYTFETRLLAVGAIDFGFLDGDLLVVGSGDPTIDDWDGIASQLFERWAERLKAAGIRVIGGRIIGDDNLFDDETFGSGWAWDDLSSSFAAGVGALQFNQNTARVRVTAGNVPGARVGAIVMPDGSGLTIRNLVVTGPSTSPISITTHRLPGTAVLELRGTVPAGFPPFFRNVSVDNPTLYFITRLRDALVANGIEVRGKAVDIDQILDAPNRDEGSPIVVHRSEPLRTIAGTMMKLSQNLYAESLLRATGGPSNVMTAEAGRKAIAATLEEWGLDPSDVLLADGSGLSRYNLVTPAALAAVLTYVYRADHLREPFQASLPLAGREGTIAGRMKGTAAEANARAKSGAFGNTRTLSGYVWSGDGEPLAFSIMTNNIGGSNGLVEAVQDAVVVRLASFSRR